MISLISYRKAVQKFFYVFSLLIIQITPSYCVEDTIETEKLLSSKIIYKYDMPNDLETYKPLQVTNDPLWYFDKYEDICINQHIKFKQPFFLSCRNLFLTGSITADLIEIEADNIICYNQNEFRLMWKLKSNSRNNCGQVISDPFNNTTNLFNCKLSYLNALYEDPGLMKAEHIKLYARYDVALLGNVIYGRSGITIKAGRDLYIETGHEQCTFERVTFKKDGTSLHEIDKTIITKKYSLPSAVIGSVGKVNFKTGSRYIDNGLVNLTHSKFS